MLTLILSFFCAAFITLLVVRSAKMHGHRSGDRDFSKPQKLHTSAVPRIGGLGIVLGVALSFLGRINEPGGVLLAFVLLACALPAFAAGFIQDFTEAITPRGRLLAAALSAGLAHLALNATIRNTGIPGLDWLVQFEVGAVALTVFTVAGIANAVNIIDGLNGLAAMCAVLMLSAICYVAFQVGDIWVANMALAGVGAVLGFFLWNYPAGLIFLGDGGAYFLGFYVAELAILLLVRNPSVSPMFPLLTCIYPVFETLFSVYRRVVLRKRPPQMPDGIHLHTLVYRRLMRWAVGRRGGISPARRNSMTSPILWALCMVAVVPATLFWDNTTVLMICIACFGLVYTSLYWRIVRFNVPRWLRVATLHQALRKAKGPRT